MSVSQLLHHCGELSRVLFAESDIWPVFHYPVGWQNIEILNFKVKWVGALFFFSGRAWRPLPLSISISLHYDGSKLEVMLLSGYPAIRTNHNVRIVLTRKRLTTIFGQNKFNFGRKNETGYWKGFHRSWLIETKGQEKGIQVLTIDIQIPIHGPP